MMDMKIMPPSLSLFAAKLASPPVAVFDCLADGLPVEGVIPICDAALPGRVVGPACGTGKNERFSGRAASNSILNEPPVNGMPVNAELTGYIYCRSSLYDILTSKPEFIVILPLGPVVAGEILVPSVFGSLPSHRATAPAFTERWCLAVRRLPSDGVSMSPLSLAGRADRHSALPEMTKDSLESNSELLGNFMTATPCPVGQARGVEFDDGENVIAG